MKLRIVTGLLGAIGLISLIMWAPTQAVLAVVLIAAWLAYREFDHLFFSTKSIYRPIRMTVLIFLTIAAMRESPTGGWFCSWFSMVFLSIMHFFRAQRGEAIRQAVSQLSMEFLGYTYVVCLLGFLLPIMQIGRDVLLLLFLIVFIGDTAAYFGGMLFGSRRLVPRVSPKKTVEGAVAAMLGSTLAAWLWFKFLQTTPLLDGLQWPIILFAPLISVLAQIGDLFESMLKRSQGEKDSGTLLPGHGGILDRIDGLALSSPVFYVFLLTLISEV